MLQGYCDTGVNGCVYFTAVGGASGRIVINDGKITSIGFANQRGNRAMSAMENIDIESFRYDQPKFTSIPDRRLPDTPAILDKLAAVSGGLASNSQVVARPEKRSQSTQISKKAVELIESELTDLIGPMANFLCEEHVYKAGSVIEALKNLSGEISSQESQQLEKVLSLNGLL